MIFTEEQELFRQTVREFAQKEIAPLVPEILATNNYPSELYQKACDLDFTCVNVPEEAGGVGLGQVEACIIFEEIGKVCPGFNLSLEIIIVTAYVLTENPVLGEKYREKLYKGGITLGSAYTPPEGQSNVTEHKHFFTKVDGGYLANGIRLYGTNCDADIISVAGTDEESTTYLAFVEKAWGGLEVSEYDKKLGIAGNRGGTMIFKDMFVPEENMTLMSRGSANVYYQVYDGCAAEALGCAKGIFEKTLEFCKNRTHNYRPLTDLTAVSYKLGELQSKILMAEAMVYDCAELEVAYETTGDEALHDRWIIMAEATKARVGEILMDVSYECVKLNGGIGFHDPEVWHYLGDQLNYCIMDIPNEMHYRAIAALMGI